MADSAHAHWILLTLGTLAATACSGKTADPASDSDNSTTTTGHAGSTVTSGTGSETSQDTGTGGSTTSAGSTESTTGVTTASAVGSVSGGFGSTGSSCELFGTLCTCKGLSSPVALDETTPLGFSAEQVLAFATGSRQAPLVYELDNFSGVDLSLPAQATTLTLTIEPAGTANFVADANNPSGLCADILEIDVEVTFSTADGAFNEQFSDRLLVAEPSRAHLSRPIDLESLQGNLSLGLPDGARLSEGPQFHAVLGDGFLVGDITGMISPGCDASGCSAGSVRFAAWSDGGCPNREIPVTNAADAATIIAEALDRVNSVSPVTVTWGSGDASDLFFDVSPSDAVVCEAHAGFLPELRATGYLFYADVSATSADERFDTMLPVKMEASYYADGQARVAFGNYDHRTLVEVGSFEETYGLSDVEFGGLLEAYLYFFLETKYTEGSDEPSSVVGWLEVGDGQTIVEKPQISAGQ